MESGVLAIMGEVAGAGAALAGLILVFLGGTVGAYEALDTPAQKILRSKYQMRVWLAFAGLALSMAATGGAIAAKAAAGAWLACAALVLLSISAAAVVLAAFQSARDVG